MSHLSTFAVHWIQTGGYIGIFVAMILESACIPLPSEVIMPFGGYLAWAGHLQLWIVIILGILGNVVGSLVAYYVGKYGGRPLLNRYGRYVRLSQRHLDLAEDWFNRRGEWAVFIGRLLPGIRTFISLPAGIARMSILRFTIYTALGSLPWVALLGYGGYKLGQDWAGVKHYTHPLLYIAAIIVVVFVVGGIYRNRKKGA